MSYLPIVTITVRVFLYNQPELTPTLPTNHYFHKVPVKQAAGMEVDQSPPGQPDGVRELICRR